MWSACSRAPCVRENGNLRIPENLIIRWPSVSHLLLPCTLQKHKNNDNTLSVKPLIWTSIDSCQNQHPLTNITWLSCGFRCKIGRFTLTCHWQVSHDCMGDSGVRSVVLPLHVSWYKMSPLLTWKNKYALPSSWRSIDRLSKKSFVSFNMVWDEGLFLLDLATQKWITALRPIKVALWDPWG